MRRPVLLAGAPLAALLLAGPAAGEESAAATVRASILEWISEQHLDPAEFEVDALAEEAARRRASAGPAAAGRWLGDALTRAQYAFAPRAATPDPRARYALPFDPRLPRLLAQGVGGTVSHQGREHFAFDFVMPIGTPVLAAREGVVARVVDGFQEGGMEERFKGASNAVFVLHEDGTFGIYSHLSPGIPVERGQRVGRRDVVGASGKTGWLRNPHLHFSVWAVDPEGLPRSVPIRFGRPGRLGFVPEQGQYIGALPRPNVRLEIRVDGRRVDDSVQVPIRAGGAAELEIFVLGPGEPRPITGSETLRVASSTPWSLHVEGGRRIQAEPAPGFEDAAADPVMDTSYGSVAVVYEDRERRQVGLGRVEVRIVPAAGGR